jgi:hypothetical protein
VVIDPTDKNVAVATVGKLVRVEEKAEGVASVATWRNWAIAAGGVPFLLIQFLSLAFDRAT